MNTKSRKIALVTGASSGIGQATAELLAQAGYKVYGTSRRGGEGGGRSFEMLPLDVTDDASVQAAVQQRHGDEAHPGQPNRISAQAHLAKFYAEFGYAPVGEPYEEDKIPHLEMLRRP